MEKDPSDDDFLLTPEQQTKYNSVIKFCPEAANRKNYTIISLTQEPHNSENQIY